MSKDPSKEFGTLQPGYWIPIYNDPDTEMDRQGLAILIRQVTAIMPPGYEAWEVKFQDTEKTCIRMVKSTVD